MSDEDEQDELVEPDRLLPFGRSIFIPQSGIDYVLIEGSKYRNDRVTHRNRINEFAIKGFSLIPTVNVRRQYFIIGPVI